MTERFVVLVCGGRTFANWEKVNLWLSLYHSAQPFTKIVQGAAAGADSLARQWAREQGIEDSGDKYMVTRDDWRIHGMMAGPVRNQKMLDKEQPDLVIAFPGGSGTRDMITRSRSQGYRVVEVP